MVTISPNKGYQIPTVGGDPGPSFANEISATLAIIDSNLGGQNSLSVSGASNVTLTAGQAQNLIQQFTGALAGNITVFLPAVGSFYCIENATTGAFSLSVGCTNGSNALQIPQGLSSFVWTDGSVVRLSNPPGWTEIATYIVSGAASQTVLLPGPFRRFRLTLQSMTMATFNTYLTVVGSINGGASFVSTGYSFANWVTESSGVTGGGFGPNPQSGITITGGNQVNVVFDGVYEIGPFTNGFYLKGLVTGIVNTGATYTEMIGGAAGALGGAVNAVAVRASSGTFSGTIIVEGLP